MKLCTTKHDNCSSLGGNGEQDDALENRCDIEENDDVSTSAGRQFESDERVLALAYCRMAVEEKKDPFNGTLGRFNCGIFGNQIKSNSNTTFTNLQKRIG